MLQSNYSKLITTGSNIGGLSAVSNKFFIKENEWFGVTRISETAGYPEGYGNKSFAMPLKGGSISSFDSISFNTSANMANGSLSFSVDTTADLFAIAQLGAVTNISIATSGAVIGALDMIASDTISLLTQGELSSVLEAFATDNISISSSADLIGVLDMSVNDSFSITTDANAYLVFEGSGTSTISVGMSCDAIFGSGYASAQLTTLLFGGSGTLTAVGYMGGTTETDNGTLTPAQIWSYDTRTLTAIDVEVSGLTQDEHDKLLEVHKILGNDKEVKNNQLIIYSDDGTTPLIVWDLKDKNGNATETSVFKSERV